MEILNAIIQGIIQGLSEFLPVSSSGHLLLYQYLTGNSGEAGLFMSVVLHLGTLLAVFVAFRSTISALIKEFFVMVRDIMNKKFRFDRMNSTRRMIIMLVISTAVLLPFYILKKPIEKFSGNPNMIILGVFFLLTSFLLFMSGIRKEGKKEKRDITYKNALLIGAFQGVALAPGISRSGSTISGGLLCGFTRETAVRYSFILGIPAILGSCLVELKEAFESPDEVIRLFPCIIGFIVSATVGLFAIKLVRMLLKENKFQIFAYYTLILGVVVVTAGIFERVMQKPIMNFFK